MFLIFPEITPGPQLSLLWWQTTNCHQAWKEVLSLSMKAGLNKNSVQSNKSSRQMHHYNIFMLYVMYFVLIWFENMIHWLNWIWTEPSCVVIIYDSFGTFCFPSGLKNSLKLLSCKDTSVTRQLQNLVLTALTQQQSVFHLSVVQIRLNFQEVRIIVFPSTAGTLICQY